MMWAVIILGVSNILALFLIVFQQLAHQSELEKHQSRSWKAVMDMADKIQQPDARVMEAIRANAVVQPTEKDPLIAEDEKWLASDESMLDMNDDLSPIFDPVEDL